MRFVREKYLFTKLTESKLPPLLAFPHLRGVCLETPMDMVARGLPGPACRVGCPLGAHQRSRSGFHGAQGVAMLTAQSFNNKQIQTRLLSFSNLCVIWRVARRAAALRSHSAFRALRRGTLEFSRESAPR